MPEMNETALRALIRAVLAELFPPRRALVLFTGALMGADEAIAQLAGLRQDGLTMDIAQTPSAKTILDQAAIAGLGQVAETPGVQGHDLLIVPTLTANIAAKAAHGVADCLASNVLAGFFKAGCPVVLARDGACPDGPLGHTYPAIPPGYATMLRANLTALAGFGAVITSADELRQAVAVVRCGGRPGGPVVKPRPFGQPAAVNRSGPGSGALIVSRATLAACPAGSTYTLLAGARLTPAARDTARARHITIVSQEDGHVLG